MKARAGVADGAAGREGRVLRGGLDAPVDHVYEPVGDRGFLAGALFELLIWSLEARPPVAAEQADALFHELAEAALAAALDAQGGPALRP